MTTDKVDGYEIVGLGIPFEGWTPGRRLRTVGRTITDADITNFVCVTGMLEVLFTNLDYLEKESLIKGRLAPGALVYSFAEGLLMQSVMQHTGLAFLGMELKILAPSFAGDTIHVRCEVTEARPTSKPGRGIVTTFNEVVNQKGDVVLTYKVTRMVKSKNA
ncbi:MaoC family dehydratase [Enterovirga rhinocerotis]|uniref:Acyl dehydratase n=1 Tax=Enterovirga rhinocerotis TaxID=1339210 RepID=A0A4R7C1U0_9HYPH|nr:MaoC/PaaZ C-terminal domain-containing protein [Enterovirga rhinocerotis]TDR90366.1 acyl dehydratase [Enterovirga rhinocerotis]